MAVLGASAPARAEHMHPYAPISAAASIVVRDDHGGGTETSAAGANLEIALGKGRFQYFVEGSTAYLSTEGGGSELRGGLGVRWLARSFELGPGAFELGLEGLAGLAKVNHDMTQTSRTYPDIGFGVAWSIRFVDPRVTFRVSTRAMFAQTSRDDMTAACRGRCVDPASSVPGFVVLFGFGY